MATRHKAHRPSPDELRPDGWAVPTGVVVGAAIGLLYGIMLEQIAMGLVIGAAAGLGVGAAATVAMATRRPPHAGAPVPSVILAAGAIVIAIVLLR